MAAPKKRKLDGSGSGSGSGSSTPTMMSAFAARQQLWGVAATRNSTAVEKATAEPAPENVTQPGRSDRSSKRQATEEPVLGSTTAPTTTSADSKPRQTAIESGQPRAGSTTPRVESAEAPVRQHSSFRPSKKNLQRRAGGRIVLTCPEAERLVLLGSYGVKVQEGEATIAGAILTPSDEVQWVHAPLCHAVPVLRAADDTVLEVLPHPAAKGLRQLAKLNPCFARLWNETASQESARSKPSKSLGTFQIIYTSDDVPKRAALQELVSPAEWNKKLSGLAAGKPRGAPAIFLCGPKSSGKSTFGRLLANRLITDRRGSKNELWSSVMVLDLDPGQPEYSPPGVVSLSKIAVPNLSPSFCHPILPPHDGQLRAHAIASVNPGLDPAHFIECALDLYAHYQRSRDAKYPLIINTPGWIQGTGLDILSDLITAIRPTEVIYMSQDGPDDTVSTLQSACNAAAAAAAPIPFTTLPSQPSDMSSRTSLHLRTMQTMSYFHLRQPEPPLQQPAALSWDPTPLTDLRPWRVRYAGPPSRRGFLGILCYDHQPAPSLLAEAINGTVLALAKLESRAALRDLRPLDYSDDDDSLSTNHPTEPETDPNQLTPNDEGDDGNIYNGNASHHTKQHKHHRKQQSAPPPSSTLKPPPITTALPTDLPLIPNPQGRTLDPRHSHLLGLVLVRGVDTSRRELQLLTPLAPETVAGLRGEELVLVAGRFDPPSWAYSEGLYRSRRRRGAARAGSGRDADSATDSESGSASASLGEGDDEDDVEVEGEEEEEEEEEERMVAGEEGMEVPWVEVLHGSQRRAVGSKVWRVRRDLGRS